MTGLLVPIEVDFDHGRIAQKVHFPDFNAHDFDAGAGLQVTNQFVTFPLMQQVDSIVNDHFGRYVSNGPQAIQNECQNPDQHIGCCNQQE